MISIDGFYNKECNKIDAACINAYFDMTLDLDDPTKLKFGNSWGDITLDLTPAIKAGETLTYLKLAPEGAPTYLEYDGEDGIPQCISGDDLSQIISMTKLKDVDQTTPPEDGDVYMYDGTTNTFKTFDLKTFVTNVNNLLSSLQQYVSNLQDVTTQIQQVINKPSGIPDDAVIAWGNRNIYADYTNTNKKDHGIFTHNTSTNLADDQFFA